jgi:hypothetical protein
MTFEQPTAKVDDYLQAINSLEGEGDTVFSARLARDAADCLGNGAPDGAR